MTRPGPKGYPEAVKAEAVLMAEATSVKEAALTYGVSAPAISGWRQEQHTDPEGLRALLLDVETRKRVAELAERAMEKRLAALQADIPAESARDLRDQAVAAGIMRDIAMDYREGRRAKQEQQTAVVINMPAYPDIAAAPAVEQLPPADPPA